MVTGPFTMATLNLANYDLGYLSDVANYQVKIRRDGYYQIVGNAMFTNPVAYSHYVTVDGSNLVANNTPGNTNGCSSQATGVFNLGTGALIKQTLYQATGSSQNTYASSNPCSLTVFEIPKW